MREALQGNGSEMAFEKIAPRRRPGSRLKRSDCPLPAQVGLTAGSPDR